MQVHLCDGCGKRSPTDELSLRGFTQARGYCEACCVVVGKFEEKRDALHTGLALKWSEGLTKLENTFKKQLPNGKLPDEAE